MHVIISEILYQYLKAQFKYTTKMLKNIIDSEKLV